MTSGGARTRSGPAKDPNSRESARNGLTFKLLPRGGYQGPIPDFPLPEVTVRELQVWSEVWRTPQAAMWEAEQWQIPLVALYVRTRVRGEAFDAPGNVFTNLHRLGDQLGLTPAGLAFNGWRLAPAGAGSATGDEPVEPAAPAADDDAPRTTRPVRRLRGEAAS
jgi:hypothetical protein